MRRWTTPGFARIRAIAVIACLIFDVISSLAQSPSPERVEAFFNAIQRQDAALATAMLENSSNLTHALYYGRLPLHVAAASGSVEIVRELLKHGADINARNDTLNSSGLQLTALCAAISYGHSNVCELLLQSGANPNIQSTFDGGALHYAIEHRRTNLVERLLDFGADPFLEKDRPFNSGGITPFELEIMKADGRAIPRMLATGRKLDASSKSQSASARNRKANLRQKVSDFLAEHGPALLIAATQRGELEAVEALVDAGVPVKGTNAETQPILQALASAEAAAARTRNFESSRWSQIFAFLIKKGANYDVFAATGLGDLTEAHRLLSKNKRLVDAKDRDGQTPLHWAVQTERLPMTSFWIESGASLGATNSAGQTALHIAAAKGLAEQMKLLLAARGPTQLRDTNGWTPLDAAIQAKQPTTIRLLLADKPPESDPERGISTPLHEAAAGGKIGLLTALTETETSTNLEARDELGFTPLQLAVRHGHLAAAAWLVDKGANIGVRDTNGNTLLHEVLLENRQLIVYDRPPTSWLDRMGADPRKELYRQYLTVGPYEQGPHPILQTVSFLIAGGLDARATNHAGQTALQLATDEKVSERLLFFEGDREKLLKLLGAGGADVNQRDANGNTALLLATNDLSTEAIASLIASGADVNVTNSQGRTPLHLYAERVNGWAEGDGSAEPFQLLLKSKANVNAQDVDGLTPLHLVALSDSSFKKEATQTLLDAGANPNLRDNQGRTPIHAFLSGKWPWRGAEECIPLLIKAGADLSAKDNGGKTPLHYLAALGYERPLFFLSGISSLFATAKVDVDARDNEGNTPLHIAAKYGTHDVYEWLLKQGASLDETNGAGENARVIATRQTDPFARADFRSDTDIFVAAREGKLETVTGLLKDNPNLLNENNVLGQTPLVVAVQSRRTNVMEFLDQKGAKWDADSAVRAGRIDKIQEILADDPTAATRSYHGLTLLDLVVVNNGNIETAKLLLEHHADASAQSPWGFSPLGMALAKRRTGLADLLRQHGARENIFDAVYCDDVSAVKNLLSADMSLAQITSSTGASPIDIAVRVDNVNMLKLLLDLGVSPAMGNPKNGRTPLHIAACFDATNCATLLLRKKVDVNAIDYNGFSPVHFAAMRGSAGVADLLLKHKADPNIRVAAAPSIRPMPMPWANGTAGCTALHLAAMYGETNVLTLLLQHGASINTINLNRLTALDLATQQNWEGQPVSVEFELGRVYGPLADQGRLQSNLLQRLYNQRKAAAELLKKQGTQTANQLSQ